MSDNKDTKEKKVPKKKGPIRFEAIIPVLVLSVITFAYFSYYFDRHLFICWVGSSYEVLADKI